MNPLLLLFGILGAATGLGGKKLGGKSHDTPQKGVAISDSTDVMEPMEGDSTNNADNITGKGSASVELSVVVYDREGSVVRTIADDSAIDFGSADISGYSVGAVIAASDLTGLAIGSVVFQAGDAVYIELHSPYNMPADAVDLTQGNHNINVLVYSGSDGTGELLATKSVSFQTTASVIEDMESVDDDPMHGDDYMPEGDGLGGHTMPDILPPGTSASQADINAYLEALAAAPDGHIHSNDAGMAAEHMAALGLVPRGEATHVAIGDGAWFDPATWSNGEVPGDDARVLIPEGVTVHYGGVSEARLFTVRVDGTLDFATDVDSRLIFDTMVASPTSHLIIGTADNPVDPDVDIDLIVANNGSIDTNWDPMLLSRGIIAHGETTIHGAIKDSHEKVIEDPMAGDTSVTFAEVPEGWQVGDTIVIAGTHYDGYKWDNNIRATRLYPNEDEVRVITQIDSDGRIHFDDPLVFDHDAPREDLKTSVANYTRNVSIETENAETAEVYERGHVMFMHSDDVDVRYAEFHELGRTDKSVESQDVSDFGTTSFDSNVQGRYSLHIHKAGTTSLEDPAILEGNAVYGSPGWGIVHHDSNALITNNATYDTFGAGYVAETGNETGAWIDNIAIYAEGISWDSPKNTSNISGNFDTGRGGDGFWFQGRMVASIDNVAASVNTGFVYFHRNGDDRMIEFDAALFEYPAALYHDDAVMADKTPILSFQGNETFASKEGLHVVKANPNQGHDVWSQLDEFTAWSVINGAKMEYTSHYILSNFDLVAKEPTAFSAPGDGIGFGTNTTEMVIIDSQISGFTVGIDLNRSFIGDITGSQDVLDFFVVDTNISNVTQEYTEYDPAFDVITSREALPHLPPDLQIDGPITFRESNDWAERIAEISGTKTDGLGTVDFPGGTDNFLLRREDVVRFLEKDGYWTTSDGHNYFLVDIYFTDRLTGELYYETHPIYLDQNVPLGNAYSPYANAIDNGKAVLRH